MKFLDMFTHVKTVSVNETKRVVREQPFGEYTLLDVREQVEYEKGHIPGAVFMPLSQLPDRVAELDPEKQIIAY